MLPARPLLRFVFDWLNMSDEECIDASDEKKATFNFPFPSDFKQARSRELKIRFKAKDSDASFQAAGVPNVADLVKKVRKEVLSMARTVAVNTPDVMVAGKRSGDVHFDPKSDVKKRKTSRKNQNPNTLASASGQSPTISHYLNLRQLEIQQGRVSLWNHDQVPTHAIIQNNPFLLPNIEEVAHESLRSRWVEHGLPHNTNFSHFVRANNQHHLGNLAIPLDLTQSMASDKIALLALLSSGSSNSSLAPQSTTMAVNPWLLSQSTSFVSHGHINPFVSNLTSCDKIPTSTAYAGRSPGCLAILCQIFGPPCHHFLDSNGVSTESRFHLR